MGRYAAETEGSPERSRAEIETLLERYGCTAFAYGWEGRYRLIGFQMANRHIRIRLPLPTLEDDVVQLTETGKVRTATQARAAHDRLIRQRWRVLVLVIKAKLEAIEIGVTTLEEQFLSETIIPDGRTVGEWLRPQLDAIQQRQSDLPHLLGPGGKG